MLSILYVISSDKSQNFFQIYTLIIYITFGKYTCTMYLYVTAQNAFGICDI